MDSRDSDVLVFICDCVENAFYVLALVHVHAAKFLEVAILGRASRFQKNCWEVDTLSQKGLCCLREAQLQHQQMQNQKKVKFKSYS